MTADSAPQGRIPSVERILSSEEGLRASDQWGRIRLRDAVRDVLQQVREEGTPVPPIPGIVAEAGRLLERTARPSLRRAVNATGVIIHTNLGRSPISPVIFERAREILEHYSNLELDLETGGRGRRHAHLDTICSELFGAEAALLVNNNAAGILLVLASLSSGREVVISRGELVEIGGAFRVPEVIEQGGCILREVGTTNRTRAADYAQAAGSAAGALLSVHRSNFEIVGFTESPGVSELVAVARAAGIPYVVDEGSGRVVDLSKWGFSSQPTVRELLAAGVDVVTCSTDKLIGGPQGGLILGRRDLLDRCARHPLMRALRPGKESFALVRATLESFVTGLHEEEIGIYRMLAAPLAELERRARAIAPPGASIVESRAVLGGGTTPTESMPSIALRLEGDAEALQESLRRGDVPIIARIEEDAVLLDMRTIDASEDELVRVQLQSE